MGGTLNNIYENVNFALHLHAEAITRLQEQASTGNRINRASDDPSAAYRILGLNSQGRFLRDYLDILSEIVGKLEISTTVLDSMTSSLAEARRQLTQVGSGTYSQEARQRTAPAINDILEQMVSFANTKHGDQYLFGGSDTTSAPYVAERSDGEITAVTYQGSVQTLEVEVAPGLRSSAFCIGDDIFRSDNRRGPVFLGSTGAKAGAGTSSIRGDVWLTVTYNEGTGKYELCLEGGEKTVVEGDITNLAVKNSAGQVLYVDATEITSEGVQLVRIPGTYDIFGTLISIRDILKNEKGLADTEVQQLVNDSLNALEEISNLLVQAEVSVGSRIGFLDNLKDTLKNMKYDTEDETTRLEDADVAQVAIDISRREILYEMSLSVAAKLMSMSLLDFIR